MPPGGDSQDLYAQLKELQRQGEFLDIQEDYLKDEMRNLKRELIRAKEELKKIQSVPLVIGQVRVVVPSSAVQCSPCSPLLVSPFLC